MTNPNRGAKEILGTTKESEFLQSFVRIGLREEDEEEVRTSIFNQQLTKQPSNERLSEISTDKSPRKSL